MNKLILVANSNPPAPYQRALKTVGLEYRADFFPDDLSPFSGLLLTGGGDIFPPFYGLKKDFNDLNLIRDATEFKLIDYFFSKNLPILGICRGLQVINVFFGGTLKNVDCHYGGESDINHPVITTEKGFLKGICLVNSNHRQAVDTPCENAENFCFAHDNTIEGFTINDTVLAVQFHPERMDLGAIFAVYGSFANLVKNRKKV